MLSQGPCDAVIIQILVEGSIGCIYFETECLVAILYRASIDFGTKKANMQLKNDQ